MAVGVQRWSALVVLAALAGCPGTNAPVVPKKASPRPSASSFLLSSPGGATTGSPSAAPSSVATTAGSPTPAPTTGATASPDRPATTEASASAAATPTPQPTATPHELSAATFAGSGQAGPLDAQGKAAQLDTPNGLDQDAAGNLYVADAGNQRIRKIAPDGTVSTLAGSSSGFGTTQLNSPYGVAVAADGTVYVADTGNHAIRQVEADGSLTTVAGDGTAGNADGDGTAARFHSPFALTVGPDGNLYVADAGNHAIRVVTPAGHVTTLVGGTAGWVDGPFASAKLQVPSDLAFTPDGKLFVVDTVGHMIRKLDLTLGVIATFAGSGTPGFGDGKGASAHFNAPTGLCSDATGVLYVADNANQALRKVTADGNVTTLGGSKAGFADGLLSVALFNSPTDLVMAKDGALYVSDTKNERIRVIR